MPMTSNRNSMRPRRATMDVAPKGCLSNEMKSSLLAQLNLTVKINVKSTATASKGSHLHHQSGAAFRRDSSDSSPVPPRRRFSACSREQQESQQICIDDFEFEMEEEDPATLVETRQSNQYYHNTQSTTSRRTHSSCTDLLGMVIGVERDHKKTTTWSSTIQTSTHADPGFRRCHTDNDLMFSKSKQRFSRNSLSNMKDDLSSTAPPKKPSRRGSGSTSSGEDDPTPTPPLIVLQDNSKRDERRRARRDRYKKQQQLVSITPATMNSFHNQMRRRHRSTNDLVHDLSSPVIRPPQVVSYQHHHRTASIDEEEEQQQQAITSEHRRCFSANHNLNRMSQHMMAIKKDNLNASWHNKKTAGRRNSMAASSTRSSMSHDRPSVAPLRQPSSHGEEKNDAKTNHKKEEEDKISDSATTADEMCSKSSTRGAAADPSIKSKTTTKTKKSVEEQPYHGMMGMNQMYSLTDALFEQQQEKFSMDDLVVSDLEEDDDDAIDDDDMSLLLAGSTLPSIDVNPRPTSRGAGSPSPVVYSDAPWTCFCGEDNTGDCNFCGMCATPKKWTCPKCLFGNNKCRAIFCGGCATPKKEMYR